MTNFMFLINQILKIIKKKVIYLILKVLEFLTENYIIKEKMKKKKIRKLKII